MTLGIDQRQDRLDCTVEKKRFPRGPLVVGAVALVAVAAVAASGRREAGGDIPPEAAGWYGAMSLYRAVAMWAGKRAMLAEVHYWKAVAP